MKKIILLGYMGSGKSTIAQLLSEIIGVPYLDLDQMIESKTNLSIATLFKEKGEIYFRKLEHEIFQELMCNPDPMVLIQSSQSLERPKAHLNGSGDH